ncbi:MAG: GntR family transcriptional regulator [Thermoanaerobacteraceae bacterium]|nr:GntR family transcriptional regulator [Thermoanaerobacteraceae bacterium]
MQLNFDLRKPIYLQIVDEFKRSIARGELKPGDKIPSQRELAQKVKVNPNTVQKAYQEMERIKLVETLRGQGTFIRKDESVLKNIRDEMAREALRTFLQEMKALGFVPQDILALVETEVARQEL